MTSQTTSRMTLLDLIPLINNTNLKKATKQDMTSAVRMVARVVGADLAEIHIVIGILRRRLDLVSPEALGISPRRWANVRSLLNRALALARPVMPSRSYAVITPAWLALVEGWERSSRDRIKPLLRYLSEQGVAC